MDEDAVFAACLLECGPHITGPLGDYPMFRKYYRRVFRWYQHNVRWSAGVALHSWPEFYEPYMSWVEGNNEQEKEIAKSIATTV